MIINLGRNEIELVERSLRFFFCQCDEEEFETDAAEAFDLALEFENILKITKDK